DRTDAGAPAAERSWLPGHRRQHAGFNNCVEGVALTMFAVVYARTRLGGAEQTEPMQGRRRPSAAGYRVIADSTPVSTTALRGSVDHVRCGLRAHEARRRRADRTDAGAPAAERSWLPGHRRQHAGFNNCVEGAYGIACFAEREPVDSDGHARSTCGVRELRDAPVRRSVRRWAAAARRPTSMVCWWRSYDAGGAEDRRRAPATDAQQRCDQHDT